MHIIVANENERLVPMNIQVSYSNAATDMKGVGRIYSSFFHSSTHNGKVKKILKLVYTCQSYHKNKWQFFVANDEHIYTCNEYESMLIA